MKQVFVGFILVVIVLYLGVFVVEDYQVGMVTNRYNHKVSMYTTGLHFMVPYLETVEYIDMGDSSNILTMQVHLRNTNNLNNAVLLENNQNLELGSQTTEIKNLGLQDYKASFVINWHISVPTSYYTFIVANSEDGAIKQIRELLKDKINTVALEYRALNSFDKIENLVAEPVFISKLGIVVDSVKLVQLIPVDNKAVLNPNIESQLPVTQSVNAKQIESAYYFAQNIIAHTETAKAEIYSGINTQDKKFYKYYRDLQIYKDTAQSKDDLPPLSKLY